MLPHILFVAFVVVFAARAYRNIRQGTFHLVAVSSMASAVYLTCLWIPALLQVGGQLSSKLERAGVLGSPDPSEVSSLTVRWSLELAVVGLAELTALALRRPDRPEVASVSSGFVDFRAIAYMSLLVGGVALLITPSALDDRGQLGNGVQALFNSFFVSGLAVVAYFMPRPLVIRVVLVLGVAWLATSYVRSPLVVIAIALVMGALQRGTLRSRRSIAALLVGVVGLALASSAMSAIRGHVISQEVVSTQAQLRTTVSTPLVSPFQGGIDTLDGYRFSRLLARVTPPHPLDPLMAIGSFVPRSIWTEKPEEISATLSRKYLGYGASGQFLSPVGYLTLVTGGYLSALIALWAFSASMTWWMSRVRVGVWSVIPMVILFRFFIGGGAFDISYGLRIAIPWVLIGVVTTQFRREPARSVSSLSFGKSSEARSSRQCEAGPPPRADTLTAMPGTTEGD